MTFGNRVRELRHKMELTQRELAEKLGVSISYICKVETDKLHFGDYPSEKFVCRLAEELGADLDEMLLLTDRVPPKIGRMIKRHLAVFQQLSTLNDHEVHTLLSALAVRSKTKAVAPVN